MIDSPDYGTYDKYIGIKLTSLSSDGNKIDKEIDLSNLEEYKTKVSKFLKKYNLDKEIKLYHVMIVYC